MKIAIIILAALLLLLYFMVAEIAKGLDYNTEAINEEHNKLADKHNELVRAVSDLANALMNKGIITIVTKNDDNEYKRQEDR